MGTKLSTMSVDNLVISSEQYEVGGLVCNLKFLVSFNKGDSLLL